MSTSSNLWKKTTKKKLFTNFQMCKVARWKFVVTSFLSNAMFAVQWKKNVKRDGRRCRRVHEGPRCREGSRHLRGMRLVEMRGVEELLHLSHCRPWCTWNRCICHFSFSMGLLVQWYFSFFSNATEHWAVLTTSYVQMLGRSSLPWLIVGSHFTMTPL